MSYSDRLQALSDKLDAIKSALETAIDNSEARDYISADIEERNERYQSAIEALDEACNALSDAIDALAV